MNESFYRSDSADSEQKRKGFAKLEPVPKSACRLRLYKSAKVISWLKSIESKTLKLNFYFFNNVPTYKIVKFYINNILPCLIQGKILYTYSCSNPGSKHEYSKI